MSSKRPNPQADQKELLGAALRYCAVADWFESHPCAWRKRMSVDEAMEVFSKVEAELRAAGAKAMRQHGHRNLILQGAGVPKEAR